MNEQDSTQIPTEGQPEVGNTGNENSAESSTEKTGSESSPSSGGQQNQNENQQAPIHQHPRWLERETEWNDKFSQQEQRHNEAIAALREEFGQARKDNADQTKPPAWFGGNQEAWDLYRKDRDAELAAAEERAYKRLQSVQQEESKAVKEATAFMNSEITRIEGDKTLNPKGLKIDPNKLLKIVMDNDLVDSKQRWNYAAGFAIYQSQATQQTASNMGTGKVAAAATTVADTGESKSTTFKTSADFKKSKPW